jgi:hypothetical protein
VKTTEQLTKIIWRIINEKTDQIDILCGQSNKLQICLKEAETLKKEFTSIIQEQETIICDNKVKYDALEEKRNEF